MDARTLCDGVRHADDAEVEQRWVEVFADHVQRRFNSRALVTVRVDGEPPLELAYIYAIQGGGLVLTLPSEPSDPNGDGHEGDDGHGELGHGLWSGELGTGKSEIWIGSPNQAVFEVRRIEDGVLCTGFGYLGLSRTPHLIIPRGTEPPPPRDRHTNGEF